MPIPGSLDEFEKAVEAGLGDIKQTGTKAVKQVGQDVKNQTTKDFVQSLYAPSTEQSSPQSTPQESGIEQIPGGGGGQPGAQHIAPPQPKSEEGQLQGQKSSANFRQQLSGMPDAANASGPLVDQFRVLSPSGPTSSLGEQLTGQSDKQDIMKMAGVNPTQQMSAEDRAKLNDTQKGQREQMRLHNREYIKFGTPLDPIGTLEEQIQKERKKKEEEEKKKQQEEEEKKKKKKEEEQKRRELQPPRGKKTGTPNFAVKKEQTKAEMHRGTSG